MPAIITDKLRIINCTNFINDVSNGGYYTFIGLPNANSLYPNWDSTKPSPTDNELYLNSYSDSILGVKQITSSDIIRVIPKNVWTSGKRYEMYRHDYSVQNLSPVTFSTRLYDSLYYVMNSEYRVYICIYNGALPASNIGSVVSTQEPVHTDLAPRLESDGYIWKYLYTLSPSDFLKFDSTNYISVPNNWNNSENEEISRVREGSVDGKIEAILVENNSTSTYPYSNQTLQNVPIKGDGTGGLASVTFNELGRPIKVDVTNGGSGYTFATLDLDSVTQITEGNKAIFNVIIPPKGGHGFDIYNELGAFRALIYSRIENNSSNPDFIVGNQFSRIGIIKGLETYDGTELFSESTGSGVHAIKITGDASSETYDSIITQSNTGAIGNLVNFDPNTKVLRYVQPRYNNLDTYLDGNSNIQIDYKYSNSVSGLTTATNYTYRNFDTSSITIGTNTYTIDTTFSGDNTTVSSVVYYLGQTFTSGLANPDINTKSGEIVYVDNRVSVTRSSQQREDIKIILEF